MIDGPDIYPTLLGALARQFRDVLYPGAAQIGIGQVVPAAIRRHRQVDFHVVEGAGIGVFHGQTLLGFPRLPHGTHVRHAQRNLTKFVRRLGVARRAGEILLEAGGRGGRLGERGVGADAGCCRDLVLHKPVNEDDLGSA